MTQTLTTKQILTFITKRLDDGKAEDIQTLDIRPVSTMADYMVIATGTSSRHVLSLAHHLTEDLKDKDIRPLNNHEKSSGHWVALDLGQVIVHIFTAEARLTYDLEGLWRLPSPKRTRTKRQKNA